MVESDWAFAEAEKVFPKECMLGINMGMSATDWNWAGSRYFRLCKRICDKVKGALIDERMGEKPVFRRLRKLITQEWRTRLSARTGGDGVLSFRGFRGTYEADFGGGNVVRFDVR